MDILLVDDDPRCRRLLTRLLERAGFEVIAELGDGLEAIALLEQIQVDLIITDCQMPQMDGLTLARHIRESGDATPIIMVSGHTDPSIAAEALQCGIAAFFPKPLNGAQLVRFLQRNVSVAA